MSYCVLETLSQIPAIHAWKETKWVYKEKGKNQHRELSPLLIQNNFLPSLGGEGCFSQPRLEPDPLFKLENIDIWLKTKPNQSLIGIRNNAFDPLKSAKKLWIIEAQNIKSSLNLLL